MINSNIGFIRGDSFSESEASATIYNVCQKVEWRVSDVRLSVKRFNENPALSLFVRDEDNKEGIGYAVMRPWKSKTGKQHRMYLSFIAVDPFYQGQKIGKQLLNKILDIARENGAVKVKVEHDNVPKLNAFYEKSTDYAFKSKLVGVNWRGIEESRSTYTLAEELEAEAV